VDCRIPEERLVEAAANVGCLEMERSSSA